ncbi:hypothetical protein FH972_017480 [Carpinus fangiana]|uniref:Uncharacterized protein n=1 Tax=Carpinus fangiana TaxID=176857 RepID=A0A5N6RMZ0_9ROSI|nr:hypothetical protein FH972_017480 [Carpinus fangiana]
MPQWDSNTNPSVQSEQEMGSIGVGRPENRPYERSKSEKEMGSIGVGRLESRPYERSESEQEMGSIGVGRPESRPYERSEITQMPHWDSNSNPFVQSEDSKHNMGSTGVGRPEKRPNKSSVAPPKKIPAPRPITSKKGVAKGKRVVKDAVDEAHAKRSKVKPNWKC